MRPSRPAKGSISPAAPASSLQWHDVKNLSTTERQALHHFNTFVASRLVGYLVSDLWTYTVAQRCYSTPVVRSAVLALSSAHLDLSINPLSPVPGSPKAARGIATLQLYNEAIADLRVYITESDAPSRADVLLSCAALICCDLMRGDREQATKHVDHGAAVVRAWQREVVKRPADCQRDEDFDELQAFFSALDLHATTFDDSRLPSLCLWHRDGGMASSLPTKFTNLQQAQRYLVQIQSAAFVDLIKSAPHKFQRLPQIPVDLVLRRRMTRASFEGWSSAFAHLETEWLHSAKAHSRKEQAALFVLKMHHLTLQLLLDESFQEGDFRRPFDEAGDQLLRWAEQALQLLPSQDCFSIDVGLSPPLFLLVLKTTHISVRQRGTALLACVQKLEGWHRPQVMLQAVNDLAVWQAGGDAQPVGKGTAMALEYVAENASNLNGGVKRSLWLDVVDDAGPTAVQAVLQ
ncbi:hypothetical protein LTR97_005893 [Elasticomyces elasticus]|uniref:Transcription factor domain-containing protein n=1 Tax=Elasticomyces elasticus TaxID=574655 RepID=A0AAN7VSH8_9PEZI|nr:hypothetical protein LTR97_005893 [Elasticomyces elasticus]